MNAMLTYTPEAESFRTEVRKWLQANLPKGWFDPDFEMSHEDRKKFNEGWPEKLFEGGWICATWPKEYGGKGLTTLQGVVLAEEFANAKAPMRADFFGDTLVGPTLLQWGTEEQKKESRTTNAKFASDNDEFISACANAEIKPTARQAGKWRNRKGKAWKLSHV